MEIIFFRNLLIVLIIPLILKSKKIPFWGNNRSVLLLRSLFGTFGMVAYFYTIGFMPLTVAVTIQLLSPFFIIISAGIFLREKIVPKQIYIFICAFIGVLLIIKPSLYLNIFPVIIGILGAILSAGAHVTVRYLRLSDHPLVIVNCYGFVSTLVSLVILSWQRNFCIPDAVSFFTLFLISVRV